MQIHKLVVSVLDFDELGAEGVRQVLEDAHFPNRCINPDVVSVETRDIGEWSDDNPLNKNDTASAEFERLFAPTAPPVAAPGASIDTPEFSNMMLEYALLSHQPPYLERIFAHIDTHAAQHGERRAEEVAAHQQNHIEELKAQLAGEQSLATVAMKERDALQASLARLVEGIEGLTQWRSCIAEYNSGESLCKAETSWIGRRVVLHADLSALLPAKTDKPTEGDDHA